MDSLFEGFAKEAASSVEKQIEDCVAKHVEEEFYPKLVKFLQAGIYQATLNGETSYSPTAFIPKVHQNSPRNIFGSPLICDLYVDVPRDMTLTICGVTHRFDIPEEMRDKYRLRALDMFIAEYTGVRSPELIEFEYTREVNEGVFVYNHFGDNYYGSESDCDEEDSDQRVEYRKYTLTFKF